MEQKVTGFLAEPSVQKLSQEILGRRPQPGLPLLWLHTAGERPAEMREKFSVGVTLPSPFSDSLLLNIFSPSESVNLLLFSKLI